MNMLRDIAGLPLKIYTSRLLKDYQFSADQAWDFWEIANQEVDVIRKNGKLGTGILPGAKIELIRFPQQDVLQEELTAFVKSVNHREAPEVNGSVGRNALNIALNIMEQIR